MGEGRPQGHRRGRGRGAGSSGPTSDELVPVFDVGQTRGPTSPPRPVAVRADVGVREGVAPRVGAIRVEPSALGGPSLEDRPSPQRAQDGLLATAVYYAGTSRLEIGARYGLFVDGSQFKVLGPHDPSRIALDRPLAGLGAAIAGDRLLLALPDGTDSVSFVFASISGMSVQALADRLVTAARSSHP